MSGRDDQLRAAPALPDGLRHPRSNEYHLIWKDETIIKHPFDLSEAHAELSRIQDVARHHRTRAEQAERERDEARAALEQAKRALETPAVADRNAKLFDANAHPDAIRLQIPKARAAARKAQRRVAWLEELLERRTAEITAGTWPPTAEPAGEVSR